MRKQAFPAHFYGPQRGWLFGPGGGFPTDPPQEGPGASLNLVSGRRNSMDDQSIGIHADGIDTILMECIGMEWISLLSIGMDSKRPWNTVGDRLGKGQRGPGLVTTMPANQLNHPVVKPTPNCVACGAELAPPIHAPHTVYMKSLYRIVCEDYCHHHIIRAAVAAVLMTEVRAGAGPAPSSSIRWSASMAGYCRSDVQRHRCKNG